MTVPSHEAIAKRAREAELKAFLLVGKSDIGGAIAALHEANSLHRLAYEIAIGQYAEGEPTP